MMIIAIDYELCDLGIEHSQYFQGFGCSFTDYNECCYGIGNDAREALDDCLEQMAQSGVDVEELEKRILADWPDFLDEEKVEKGSVVNYLRDEYDEDDEGHDECDMYYHIGIRWNVAE